MTTVSISEAARLVGKNRRTLQRDITAGKLSKCDNGKGVDISELLRVYGAFDSATDDTDAHAAMPQDTAPVISQDVADMRSRMAALEAENAALKDHLSSLKQAMLLLEDKITTPQPKTAKKWWQFFKKD